MMYSDRRDLFVTRFNCIHLHFVFILPEMDSESSTLVSWKTNERNSHREWCILTEEICSCTRFNCIHLHFVFILPEMDSESSTLVSWKTNERNSHREWCILTEEICSCTRFNCIHLQFRLHLARNGLRIIDIGFLENQWKKFSSRMMYSDRRDLLVTRFNCIHLHFVFILPEMDSESSTLVSWKTNERNSHREWCILTEEICSCLDSLHSTSFRLHLARNGLRIIDIGFLEKPMKEILIENDIFSQKRSVRA